MGALFASPRDIRGKIIHLRVSFFSLSSCISDAPFTQETIVVVCEQVNAQLKTMKTFYWEFSLQRLYTRYKWKLRFLRSCVQERRPRHVNNSHSTDTESIKVVIVTSCVLPVLF